MLTAQVEVLPLLNKPRMQLIFFVDKMFKVDLTMVKEIFVDATFGTNSLGAHLHSILGEENGGCVPCAYMLLEAKPKEQTNTTHPEVTEALTNFFKAARDRGLMPLFAHIDKCWSEIMAVEVTSPCVYISILVIYAHCY